MSFPCGGSIDGRNRVGGITGAAAPATSTAATAATVIDACAAVYKWYIVYCMFNIDNYCACDYYLGCYTNII